MLDAGIKIKNNDLCRIGMMQVIADEIIHKNLNGSCAELGVYKGEFALCVNAIFPEKKMYLFDTFKGFDHRDTTIEDEKSFSSDQLHDQFKDTSREDVLRVMPNPHKCIIREGFFPETSVGVDDKWCFVSLDCDLYSPIYEALKFFYPNLISGGYIMIHDFNNTDFKGTRLAVEQYCTEVNIGYTPLCDSSGSVVITK